MSLIDYVLLINREDLYEMLESVNMDYLNPLEWLIRTNLKYSGDNMYVKSFENFQTVEIPLNNSMNTNLLIKNILIETCKGNNVIFGEFTINDDNRKVIHYILSKLYEKGKLYQYKKMREGILLAQNEKKYKGRKKKVVEDTELYSVYKQYKTNKISLEDALIILNISRATFYRRIKEIIK